MLIRESIDEVLDRMGVEDVDLRNAVKALPHVKAVIVAHDQIVNRENEAARRFGEGSLTLDELRDDLRHMRRNVEVLVVGAEVADVMAGSIPRQMAPPEPEPEPETKTKTKTKGEAVKATAPVPAPEAPP